MTFYARHCERELVFAPLADVVGIAVQETGGCLPHRPGSRRRQRRPLVAAGETLMVGAQEIVAFVGRDRIAVRLPTIRENIRGPMLVHPADFRVAQQKNAAQHDFTDAFRVGLGVGECQRAAPGSAEYQPAFDAKMLAKPLEIGYQVPGGVFDQTCARTAAAAAALIEHHDAVMTWIEELSRALVGTGTGT